MHDDSTGYRRDGLTERIIGCAYAVANILGVGFLERVYENALVHELRKAVLKVAPQAPVQVVYDSVVIGEYVVDILVEDTVLVELKAVKALDDIHLAQGLNYLKATGHRVCLLLNFGVPHIEVRRISL